MDTAKTTMYQGELVGGLLFQQPLHRGSLLTATQVTDLHRDNPIDTHKQEVETRCRLSIWYSRSHKGTRVVEQKANQLQIAYAVKELAYLRHLRAVVQESVAGTPQTKVAFDAGISQAEVSRILKRVKLVPGMIEECPRETILLGVIGEITHSEMMHRLEAWPYSFARDVEPENPLSERATGTWDQVTNALHRGLLSESDYEHLMERARSASVA